MRGPALLALGTVQFGLPYGLSRPSSRIVHDNASAILAAAWDGGIDKLDTAAAYGEAEQAIGAARPKDAQFSIVSKTMPVGLANIKPLDIERVVERVRQSLSLLGVAQLDDLLVHAAEDLLVPGGDNLFRGLQSLKAEGIVRRIGVSVYEPETLQKLLVYPIEVVQLPLNVFDQRFACDGSILKLSSMGIEVHVRSVFLQGLLLMERNLIPPNLARTAHLVARFHDVAGAAGLSPAAAALHYAIRQPGVRRAVIGVDHLSNLYANLDAYQEAIGFSGAIDYAALSVSSREIIDPRRWTT